MQKFKVVNIDEKSITFSTIDDMEEAYQQLADGKDIIVSYENNGEEFGEILSGKIFSDIMDGKLRLFSRRRV